MNAVCQIDLCLTTHPTEYDAGPTIDGGLQAVLYLPFSLSLLTRTPLMEFNGHVTATNGVSVVSAAWVSPVGISSLFSLSYSNATQQLFIGALTTAGTSATAFRAGASFFMSITDNSPQCIQPGRPPVPSGPCTSTITIQIFADTISNCPGNVVASIGSVGGTSTKVNWPAPNTTAIQLVGTAAPNSTFQMGTTLVLYVGKYQSPSQFAATVLQCSFEVVVTAPALVTNIPIEFSNGVIVASVIDMSGLYTGGLSLVY